MAFYGLFYLRVKSSADDILIGDVMGSEFADEFLFNGIKIAWRQFFARSTINTRKVL